jgi:hypothetical protein
MWGAYISVGILGLFFVSRYEGFQKREGKQTKKYKGIKNKKLN